jgi:hypothetical protein
MQSGNESIFGDTENGVPSPLVPHVHPYPTRYHGPIFNQPMFSQQLAINPYALAPYAGLDAAPFPLPEGVTAAEVDQTKGAIKQAMDADVAAGAGAYNADALDDLTAGFLRGVPSQLQTYIEMLQAEKRLYTAQAFQSRLVQARQGVPLVAGPGQWLRFNPANSWLGKTGWWALSSASLAASAYHGYRRNESIGWAIWWGLMGGAFPVITPAIALAQGFGKPAPRKK